MILTNQEATIISKKIIAENTVEVTFAVPGNGLIFEAGQYISVCIPSLVGVRVPDRCHDFSIASSPRNPKEISIAFRISESIFKSALLALPIGGVVSIDGPKGVLTLPSPVSNMPKIVFIAGGTGITPILSMIRYATEMSLPVEITLLYFNTSVEKIAYYEELLELQKMNKHFIFRNVIGIPEAKDFATHIQASADTIWYLVAAPKMVILVRQILNMSGVLDTKIKFEEFSGYEQ